MWDTEGVSVHHRAGARHSAKKKPHLTSPHRGISCMCLLYKPATRGNFPFPGRDPLGDLAGKGTGDSGLKKMTAAERVQTESSQPQKDDAAKKPDCAQLKVPVHSQQPERARGAARSLCAMAVVVYVVLLHFCNSVGFAESAISCME